MKVGEEVGQKSIKMCCRSPSTCCFLLDVEEGADAAAKVLGAASFAATMAAALAFERGEEGAELCCVAALTLSLCTALLAVAVRRRNTAMLAAWLAAAAAQLAGCAALLAAYAWNIGWKHPTEVQLVFEGFGVVAIVSYAYLWAVILTFRRQVRDCMTVSQRSLIRTV